VISVVIETHNLAGDGEAEAQETLRALVATLAPQLTAHGAELLITRTSALAARELAYPARWIEVPAATTYYEHKNLAFDVVSGDIVVFLDGDCIPSATWLTAITQPIADGVAQCVAGFTTYPGPRAEVGNGIDFPWFPGATRETARNFFSNNVAFASATFAARRFPRIAPMFHGQCQILALQLAAAGIAIYAARDAQVVHQPPRDVREWLYIRLLRGADCASLLPYIVNAYVPAATPFVERLGPVPAFVVLGARAVNCTVKALRRGPRMRALARVAACTVGDVLGAAARPAVYRHLL
jgi:hypothetical protein